MRPIALFDTLGVITLVFGIIYGIISIAFSLVFIAHGVPPPPTLILTPGYDVVYKLAYEHLVNLGYIPASLAQQVWGAVAANILLNFTLQFTTFIPRFASLVGAPPSLLPAAFLLGAFLDYCKLRVALKLFFGLQLPP